MLVRCPSCSHGLDIIEADQGLKAAVVCPACARVIVIQSASAHSDEGTTPVRPGTAVEEPAEPPAGRSHLALPQGKSVSLRAVAGPRKGETFPFRTARLLIGRAGGGCGAELELDDADVSRRHAAVECHGERVVLRDLVSTNGTFVGRERIESRELAAGAEFRVGASRFVLVVAPE